VIQKPRVIVIQAFEINGGKIAPLSPRLFREIIIQVAAIRVSAMRAPLMPANPAELKAAATTGGSPTGHVIAPSILLNASVAPRAGLRVLTEPACLEHIIPRALRTFAHEVARKGRVCLLPPFPADPLAAGAGGDLAASEAFDGQDERTLLADAGAKVLVGDHVGAEHGRLEPGGGLCPAEVGDIADEELPEASLLQTANERSTRF
jgi:hypothetical protein